MGWNYWCAFTAGGNTEAILHLVDVIRLGDKNDFVRALVGQVEYDWELPMVGYFQEEVNEVNEDFYTLRVRLSVSCGERMKVIFDRWKRANLREVENAYFEYFAGCSTSTQINGVAPSEFAWRATGLPCGCEPNLTLRQFYETFLLPERDPIPLGQACEECMENQMLSLATFSGLLMTRRVNRQGGYASSARPVLRMLKDRYADLLEPGVPEPTNASNNFTPKMELKFIENVEHFIRLAKEHRKHNFVLFVFLATTILDRYNGETTANKYLVESHFGKPEDFGQGEITRRISKVFNADSPHTAMDVIVSLLMYCCRDTADPTDDVNLYELRQYDLTPLRRAVMGHSALKYYVNYPPDDCPVCLKTLNDFRQFRGQIFIAEVNCGHTLCRKCFDEVKKSENPVCPCCRHDPYKLKAVRRDFS